MNVRAPAISVILPVYNAVSYVEDAVLSILRQVFVNFELIIIDDGSTDGSGKVLRKLAEQDKRIRLVQRENKGLIATLNEGIEMAAAPLLARMDADDISLPDRLATQFARMQREPDLVALGGSIQFMDVAGNLGRTVSYPRGNAVDEALLWGAPMAHPAVMLRTEAVRETGGYSDLFPHAEDYDLWLRLRDKGRLDNVRQKLLFYRLHGKSVSHIHALAQRTSTLRAQALWFAKKGTLLPLLGIEFNEEFLRSLPLSDELRIDILARMLALSPHLIGDELDDPEAAQWLQAIRKASTTFCRKRGMALFHIRVARIYKSQKLRYLKHIMQAFFIDPLVILPMLRKAFMSVFS